MAEARICLVRDGKDEQYQILLSVTSGLDQEQVSDMLHGLESLTHFLHRLQNNLAKDDNEPRENHF